MPLIKDAISSFLGKDQEWKWSEHLHPASFRGVPFAVVSGESVFGRRQAVHEYPYRDTAWIEDLGRSSRKITLRGFIIQDARTVYRNENQRAWLQVLNLLMISKPLCLLD